MEDFTLLRWHSGTQKWVQRAKQRDQIDNEARFLWKSIVKTKHQSLTNLAFMRLVPGADRVVRHICIRCIVFIYIGVRVPLDLGGGGGGGGDLIARKKVHHARKHVLYKRTQIALKTKTLPIRTSNKRTIIPKLQLNPNFSNLRGKRKLVRKMGYFEKSGVTKISVRRRRGKRLLFELSEGSKNRDSTVVISVETSHTL